MLKDYSHRLEGKNKFLLMQCPERKGKSIADISLKVVVSGVVLLLWAWITAVFMINLM